MRVLSELETEAVVGGDINGQGDPNSCNANGAPLWEEATNTCGKGKVKSASRTTTTTPREVIVNGDGVAVTGQSVTVTTDIQCQTGSDSGSNDSNDNSDNGDNSDKGSD